MSYHDLYDLVPRAFWNAVDGYWLDKENDDRREWERVRWQTSYIININLPKNRQVSLQKLLPFHWEKSEAEEPKTYEESK